MEHKHETRVYYHGETVMNQGNPPPYPGPPPGNIAGPAPQPQYGATYIPGPTATVITTVPAAVVVHRQMSPAPVSYTCPSCNVTTVTRVDVKPSMRTHLFAALLCLLGCWPCVCLPYCMESCNNADHYCSNCNAYLGSYYN